MHSNVALTPAIHELYFHYTEQMLLFDRVADSCCRSVFAGVAERGDGDRQRSVSICTLFALFVMLLTWNASVLMAVVR